MAPKASRRKKLSKPEHFTDNGRGRYYCNVCTAEDDAQRKSMTIVQATNHERTPEHIHNVESDNDNAWVSPADPQAWELGSNPWAATHDSFDWGKAPEKSKDPTDIKIREKQEWIEMCPDLVAFWQKGVVAANNGGEVDSMQEFLERLEVERAERQRALEAGEWGPVAVNNDWGWSPPNDDWGRQDQPSKGWGWALPNDDAWDAAGQDGWGLPEEKPPADRASEITDEAIANADRSSFVDKFAQCRSLSATRREKMRAFFDMPTQQKVAEIQEVIRYLHMHD
ncbi:hypothetical protein DENSPDRAFT_877691 [Dentipellis sp. KUC8613]|nr:hypothetical protein DENSPDRAFT_877691 [Dentipellis sp. KUC8613]